MPVLLDEEKIPLDRSQNGTKFGGTACEYSMATFLLSQRINCAEPIIDEGADLLVDRGDKWEKAQVKKVVYCKKLDSGMLKNSGKRVYREDFKFQFQEEVVMYLILKMEEDKERFMKLIYSTMYYLHVIEH